MNYNEAKKSLIEVLKYDSVQGEPEPGKPFGKGVYDCLCYSLELMKSMGFRVKNVDGYCGWGEIGEGELFGVLCHLDVVPVGKGWTFPPFGAEEHNGKIYARGALDDKSPFIATLYAIKALLDEGRLPKKRIRIILGCNEESGWGCMDRYVKTEEMPVMGFSPDADFPVIYCEKGIVYHSISYPKPLGLEFITAGERANMVPDEAVCKVLFDKELFEKAKLCLAETEVCGEYLAIKTHGVSAHGSTPENGENALIKLLDILRIKYPVFDELYKAFAANDGSGIGLNISDEPSGKLTLNLGTASTNANELVFELDVRHPVTYDKEFVTERLRENLTGKVEQTFFHLPLYVEKDHVLVKSLLAAYNKVMGTNAEPISIGGGTYARVLPCGVAFGPVFPGSGANIHCPDEYVDVAEFNKSMEIYYEAIKTLCF